MEQGWPAMVPAGYMAKTVVPSPEWLKAVPVVDVYSLSSCVNEDFADYRDLWRHNGYWLFDCPQIIREVANEQGLPLKGTRLFYYEVFPLQFNGSSWNPFVPNGGTLTDVVTPPERHLEGFDVVTFWAGNSPECSPLSCSSLAETIPVNSHCLLATFEEARRSLEAGAFEGGEPGPFRIFSVYSIDWPQGHPDQP